MNNVIVIGSGISGLLCAQELAQRGVKVTNFESGVFGGGLIINVNELNDFEPARGMSGIDYTTNLIKSNMTLGVQHINENVNAIRRIGDKFSVDTDDGEHLVPIVVLATGGTLRKLQIPGEEEFLGRGVSYCADCDAPLYKNAEVVVVGCDDWALHEAGVLARETATVNVVYEHPDSTSQLKARSMINDNSRIKIIADSRVEEIIGDDNGVSAVRLRNTAGVYELRCTGVFPFIGVDPNGAIVPAATKRDQNGAILVDEQFESNIPGLFAIGYVRNGFGGWLNDALSDAHEIASIIAARLK